MSFDYEGLPRWMSFNQRVFKVLVGRQELPFHVSVPITGLNSDVLAAAFNSNFREARENLLRLPDDYPAVFAMFCSWLEGHEVNLRYFGSPEFQAACSSGEILQSQELLTGRPKGRQSLRNVDFRNPLTMGILAWIFGDRIQARAFTAAVTDELYHLLQGDQDLSIQKGILDYAWRHTTQQRGLRDMLIRWISASVNMQEVAELISKEILIDVAMFLQSEHERRGLMKAPCAFYPSYRRSSPSPSPNP